MKKLLFLFTLTFLISNLNAQVTPDKQTQKPMTDFELSQYYQQKAKKQKKTAWWLLGGGAGLFTGGIILFSKGDWDNDSWVTGSGAVLLGTVSMITSIPVFIVGGKNNGRANQLLLRQSNVPISLEKNRNIQITSLGIGIPLGK